MSSFNLASLLSSQLQSMRAASVSSPSKTGAAATGSGSTQGTDFSSMLALRLAEFESQSVSALLDVGQNGDKTTIFDLISGNKATTPGENDIASLTGTASASTTSAVSPLATGYNMSLSDPAAAYAMMSFINASETNFKAQFAELRDMQGTIGTLQRSGQALGGITQASDGTTIAAQLRAFADDYNAWIARFDNSVDNGGVLDNVRAAEISYQELEMSVENRFYGATSGFHGLADLGLTIDESSNRAVLDGGALTAALAGNKQGVVATLNDFAASFAESTRLLGSSDNFIANRLANLDRAIDYLAKNKASLQSEFGTGASAQPTQQVAAALATYNRLYAG